MSRKLYSIFSIISIISVYFFSQTQIAFACSCGTRPALFEYAESDAVFTGRVISIDDSIRVENSSLPMFMTKVVFDVSQTWKGTKSSEIYLYSVSSGSCGSSFDLGEEYLVYASRYDKSEFFFSNELAVGLCNRTTPLAEQQAQEDIAQFQNPKTKIFSFLFDNLIPILVIGAIPFIGLIAFLCYKLITRFKKKSQNLVQ